MPDVRSHRGMHPQDAVLFSENQWPVLRTAVEALSWLLTKGYAEPSSLKLVGDRHQLRERQRTLVSRAACTDGQLARRESVRVLGEQIENQRVFIDGFNLLITIEAALSGAVLFTGRDGAIRDLSSVHGSYRSVEETEFALSMIGECLESLHPASVKWLLDQPVSNSGRLAQRIRDLASSRNWPWEVDLMMNPDRELMELHGEIVVTSDSLILDHVQRWLPLSEFVIHAHLSARNIIDLRT